ncbi:MULTISPECIES: ribonuclease R family protein [unclassified Picosynechococcus]|uniref:ribonuclease R family protein n=1 Tax=unclassified Picosynechococcus TaxID=3079910 RepID=UPI0004A9E689|nr:MULTISPECIES: ribonuclease R family protein [unclassified Picosynechococcus]AMA09249.1 iron ABC transporter substrate-binding protein [Picosynechococcus sp. PCC 73109]
MDFSIATLLSFFTDDKLVAGKFLEKKLECRSEEDTEQLQIILDALERSNILVKERGKYRRVPEADVVEAKLRCSSKGFCFAIQDSEDADDIYIRESYLSNAWNGDRVLVKIIKEGTRRRSPEGVVRLILERANPSLLARVVQKDEGFRAVPLDDRLLFELELQDETDRLQQAIDHLVHVSVVQYPIAQYLPQGSVTKVLGSDAEAAADTDIVCCKHDLLRQFPEEVLAAVKDIPTKLTKKMLAKRRDFRDQLTITIEDEIHLTPENQAFIENAFTLQKTEAGQWQLGIHLADVAEFVPAQGVLDRWAKKHGTAVFLGQMTIPLFPPEFKEKVELRPGGDRLTMSILLTFDDQGNVAEFEITPSVIRVNQSLSYQKIQHLLSSGETAEAELADVATLLNDLIFNLSPLVKAQRLQRGGFQISLPEVTSAFKDEGRFGTMIVSPSLPVRSLLAEVMILAGRAVAQHMLALELPAIYCYQANPDFESLENLIKLGNNLNLKLKLESEEELLPHDYQHFIQEFSQTDMTKILNYLLQETLDVPRYGAHPHPHFGLAYRDGYSRVCAPGQRYGDLVMQRILKLIFSEGRDRRSSRVKVGVNLGSSTCHNQVNWKVLPTPIQTELEETIASLILQLNDQEKVADDAEKDLQGLQKAEKMKAHTGHTFKGLITGVQSYGFFVEIEDLLVEGLVHVSSLKDDWYEYRARHSCLVGRKNRTAYRLGNTVDVEVKSVDYYRQQIDLAIAKNTNSDPDDAAAENWEEE